MEENNSVITLSVGLPAGSVALVTGAAKRLGRALSLSLAKNGCDVVAHCNRSVNEAQELVDEIAALGRRAWVLAGDLTDTDFAANIIVRANKLCSESGIVNILINNASVYLPDTLETASPDNIARNTAVHSTAPLMAIGQLAENLPDGTRGSVINMIDSRVHDVDPKHLSYHLSKRMLLDITRLAALQFGGSLSVNGIGPGIILPPEGQSMEYLERLKNSNPMGRYGDPSQIVDAAMFLLSSEFITGQVIYVDGGRHVKGAVHH